MYCTIDFEFWKGVEVVEGKATQYEHVDHPSHYGGKDSPYEAIKVIQAWLGPRGVFDFDIGNALKYICRAGSKPTESGANGMERDLNKASWYLKHAINTLETHKSGGSSTNADSSTHKEEVLHEDTTPSVLYLHGASVDMVSRLSELLTTRYGPFITMLADTAYDYEYKKGDKETSTLLKGFLDSCKSFVAEVAIDMRAKEAGVSGEAVGAEAGYGAGENYRVGGTE